MSDYESKEAPRSGEDLLSRIIRKWGEKQERADALILGGIGLGAGAVVVPGIIAALGLTAIPGIGAAMALAGTAAIVYGAAKKVGL